MMDRIKEVLERVPFSLFLGLYLGYLGWDYYDFINDDASPLITKQRETDGVKADNQKLQAKVKEGEAFLRGLDAKKVELRRLASDLDMMKATLAENLDLADFMRTTVTEAKRVGLTVVALKPGTATQKEYYAEQPFELAFRGVYVQFMLFLDRMANVQRIVRVDNFAIKPRSSALAKYVELEGVVQLKTYRYVASKADSLGRDGAAVPGGGAAPGGAKPAGGAGQSPKGGG